MKNFIQDGDVIDYENSGAVIASGATVVIGHLVGIASCDIAATTGVGPVRISGVFEVAKTTSLAIAQGDKLFWNTSTLKVTKTASDVPMGIAFAAAGSADTLVSVGLNETGSEFTPAATIAALGTTTALTALVVTATVLTPAATAGGATPSDANVNTAIDALATEVENALLLKADNTDVETLRTQVEARLDLIDAKIDAILVSIKAAGLMV